MNSYNVYEKLYADTKAAFTIVKNDKQYSLGEYMRMKAGNIALPAERKQNTGLNVVNNPISYIKEKFSAKKTDTKVKTIRKFPLRTAASAMLSAVIVCSLAISFGSFSAKNVNTVISTLSESENVEINETYFASNEK